MTMVCCGVGQGFVAAGDRAHVVAAIADSGYGKLLHPNYQV
jgi:prophage DNA circulation protein